MKKTGLSISVGEDGEKKDEEGKTQGDKVNEDE